MADALLSPFLDQLAAAIREMVEHEVRLVKGVDDEVENLSKNLKAIKLVLKDAEKRQWRDDAVNSWLEELNDISYDMDDVLDKWKTAILRTQETQSDYDQNNASFAEKLKVRLSVLCRCFHSGPLERLRHRLDIAHDIEKLNGQLNDIATRKERFNFSVATNVDEPIRRNISSSILDVSKVHGQDTYKKILKDRLLRESSPDRGNLNIIPIVGMGGIGKTTLAKLVYNDYEVKNYFGMRIWVCVSEPFDIAKIANESIKQITGQAPNAVGFEDLMQSFTACVKDEKLLLVLDDVWTDKYQEWEQLEIPLRLSEAVEKSIVVTTRKVEVAKMMGVSENLMIRVKELSETDCWLLFSEIAFFGKKEEDLEDLKPIGKEIVRKCNGLPLAAKTLGSLLRVKTTKQEWSDVLKSEIWRLENVKENLFYPLLLSYFDLPPIEKRCFSHCAIFPKDEVIFKDNIICMWMAQGYFNSQKHIEEEFTGDICFNNLAMRSFFQDFLCGWEGEIRSCKIHDIVHDFAKFITTNEYSSLAIDKFEGKVELSARHLTLSVSPHQYQTNSLLSISNHKNLHSLMVLGPETVDRSIIDWCLQFTCLRTFILKTSRLKDIPESIGDLIHLRYLSLYCFSGHDDEPRELPHTLGNLCNLQTLKVEGFDLPQEVAKLNNLRHLGFVSEVECEDCPSFPKGIERLRNLRTLHAKLCASTNNKKFQLHDLANLNSLHTLWIDDVGIEQGHIVGARKAQLNQKTSLVELLLRFDGDDNEIHNAAIEALQPPPNLKSLAIVDYSGGVICPSWMIMPSSSTLNPLKFLALHDCPNCQTLPPLGRLASLEVLRIFNMKRVKKVGPEFFGLYTVEEEEEDKISTNGRVITLFPKLKRLWFTSMESWCEWVGIPTELYNKNNIIISPRLESLEFHQCPKLEALPDFLKATPLKDLRIQDSPKLKSVCEEGIGKEWPKIQHIPNIKFV